MKKMLLHVCCAPCATHVIELLKKKFILTLFFYNPNIEPLDEYKKRLMEVVRYSKELNLPLIIGEYDNEKWHKIIEGHELDKEGGPRCSLCFRMRLKKTAELAKEKNFDIFCTTLTISPYKNASLINNIGKEIAEANSILFFEADFKKRDGYKHSIKLSKKYNLYRQHYCGCLYSKRD